MSKGSAQCSGEELHARRELDHGCQKALLHSAERSVMHAVSWAMDVGRLCSIQRRGAPCMQ
eukprot:363681-Chlamydomonas_euryale.AAC.10